MSKLHARLSLLATAALATPAHAQSTGCSRADIITSSLHRGLRDDERVQAVIDAFDEIDT